MCWKEDAQLNTFQHTTKDVSEIPELNQTKPVGVPVSWFAFEVYAMAQMQCNHLNVFSVLWELNIWVARSQFECLKTQYGMEEH